MKEKLEKLKAKIADYKREKEIREQFDFDYEYMDKDTGATKSKGKSIIAKALVAGALVGTGLFVANGVVQAYNLIDYVEDIGSVMVVENLAGKEEKDDEDSLYLELTTDGMKDAYYYKTDNDENIITDAVLKIRSEGMVKDEDIVENILSYYNVSDLGYVLFDGNVYTENGGEEFIKVKATKIIDAYEHVSKDEDGNEVTYYSAPSYGTLVGDKVYINVTMYVRCDDGGYTLPEGYVLSEIIDSNPVVALPYSELGLSVNYKISDDSVVYRYTKSK